MPNLVPAAARSFAIFEVFSREKRELSNSELARLLDLPESSCLDLLHTLTEAGYLMRTARTRRFYPTSRFQSIAEGLAVNDPLAAVAAEATEFLTGKTGETSLCGRLDGAHVRVTGFQESRYDLRYVLRVGKRLALHATALGKALLAVLPPEDAARQLRLRPLPKIGPKSETNLGELEKQIAEIRKRGWAYVEDEGGEGVTAIAVGGLVGSEPFAISLAGPTERFRRRNDEYLAAIEAARELVFPGAQKE
ncbi:Pectin degradation repressor protein KdgR [compost metagenome]|uniref:IclR family transcriptional regulator n=1 Tax=Cupriavidus oxalaticus TaxID=96344 RepID=A0A5P3VBB7_9BURK|nr:IclR family transcriptional regulator [Cupriavidus oxalaticus]QEZ43637.1 IclR family transcriptional regulator [Cupriavidus oxalaticus]